MTSAAAPAYSLPCYRCGEPVVTDEPVPPGSIAYHTDCGLPPALAQTLSLLRDVAPPGSRGLATAELALVLGVTPDAMGDRLDRLRRRGLARTRKAEKPEGGAWHFLWEATTG